MRVSGGKGAVDLLKQEEKYWLRTSALEEDEVTGEPLSIREGMDTGLEQIHLTAGQKDHSKGEVSKLWKNLDFRCSKSLVTIEMVFGPKRRRTSSIGRREDGVSYFDMVKEWAVDPRERRVGRGYTGLLGTVVIILRRKSSFNMVKETLGFDKGSNSFQSMDQRRALTCSKSARCIARPWEEGRGKDC